MARRRNQLDYVDCVVHDERLQVGLAFVLVREGWNGMCHADYLVIAVIAGSTLAASPLAEQDWMAESNGEALGEGC